MVSSQESTNSAALIESAEPAAAKKRRPYLWLFVFALAIRLWFNFASEHTSAAGDCDAAEYLRYAAAISKLDFIHPLFGPEWKEFVITGPAFPIFLWLCSLFTLKPFDSSNHALFLAANSTVSAVTATLIGSMASKLWDRRTGFIAGVLAACYPGFIVNSGRLYSETFATFVETLVLWLACRICFHSKNVCELIALGTQLIILQLTRSSMVILTVAALPFVWFQSRGLKQKLAGLGLLFAGMALVLAPWLAFEKTAFNKMSVIVDRVGNYNLFIGTNCDTEGFLAYPYPDGRGIEKKSFGQLIKEACKKSPSRFLKLCMEKPARLYKFPWNDFRTPIGPFTAAAQVACHQVIMLLALLGVCLGLFLGTTAPTREQLSGRLLFFSAWLINLPFMAFITVPRYNLMAMPTIIALAAAALGILSAKIKSSKQLKVAAVCALFLFFYLRDEISLLQFEGGGSLYYVQGLDHFSRSLISAFATAVFFTALYKARGQLEGSLRAAGVITVLCALTIIPLVAVPQRANGRPAEGILTLTQPEEKLEGKIPLDLKADQEQYQHWFLAVDNDGGRLLDGSVALNLSGKPLTHPIPALSALDDWHYLKYAAQGGAYLECSYIFNCLTTPGGITNGELRQWFYYPLSAEQVAKIFQAGGLELSIENKFEQETSLFAAAKGDKDTAVIPCRTLYSWEKAFYGVENDRGFTDPRYDEKVKSRKASWKLSKNKESETLPDLDLNIRLIRLTDAIAADDSSTTASGSKEVQLALDKSALKEGQLKLLSVSTRYENNNRIPGANPELSLQWRDNKGSHKMPLPWIKKAEHGYAAAIPLDLRCIEGDNFKAVCRMNDPNCLLTLQEKTLTGNPVSSKQELY